LVLRGADLDGNATFRLLRVVREYADERFASDAGAFEVHRRHAYYFRDLAARAAPHLVGGAKETWSSVLDAETDNVRRAFAWCLRHDSESSLAMVGSLWRWWHLRGHYREGRAAATAALQRSSRASARLRAPALTAAGLLALLACDYETAQAQLQKGLDLYSTLGDNAGLRWALALLGSVALQRGEYTVAGQLQEQALVLAKRTQDPHAEGVQLNALAQVAWLRGNFDSADERAHLALELLSGMDDQQGLVWALINVGVTARYRNDLADAKVFLADSLDRSTRMNYCEGVAWALNQLGVVSRLEGDYRSALTQQTRSLAKHRDLGNRWRMASVRDELAAIAVATQQPELATAELAAAEQLRTEIAAPVPSAERAGREQTLATARALMGPTFRALTLTGMARGAS
jgi:tetratricopeptide (TPR) repeat protein